MGTRLLFGAIGLIAALLTAYGLERLFASLRTTETLQRERVLLFHSDPEIVRRLRERGAQFGNPQFSLMWHNINDLDLHCIEPTGIHIWYQNRRSEQTGGELDVDANADSDTRTNRPVENIYWSPGRAPRGTYEVYVHHYANHGAPDPTPYTLRIVANGRVREFRGSLREGQESPHVRFDLAQVSDWEPLQESSWSGWGLLAMAGWGGLLGLILTLALRLPQRWFGVEARHFRWRAMLGAALGGAALGILSGLVGQLLFAGLAWFSEPLARYVGLMALGGLLGYGLHHCVPNLPLNPARWAGVIGGLLSAYGFLLSLAQWNDGVGRLIVAGLLGLSIGLMMTILRMRHAVARLLALKRIYPRSLP